MTLEGLHRVAKVSKWALTASIVLGVASFIGAWVTTPKPTATQGLQQYASQVLKHPPSLWLHLADVSVLVGVMSLVTWIVSVLMAGHVAKRPGPASGEECTVPAGERPAGSAESNQELVASEARSPRRWRYIVLAVVGVLVALILVAVLVPTGKSGGGKSHPVVSPAIARFVALLTRTGRQNDSAWASYGSGDSATFVNRTVAARDDLRSAAAIEPAKDGSQQWGLADSLAVAVSYTTLNEIDLAQAVEANNATDAAKSAENVRVGERESKRALDAYLAYAGRTQGQTAAPSVPLPAATLGPTTAYLKALAPVFRRDSQATRQWNKASLPGTARGTWQLYEKTMMPAEDAGAADLAAIQPPASLKQAHRHLVLAVLANNDLLAAIESGANTQGLTIGWSRVARQYRAWARAVQAAAKGEHAAIPPIVARIIKNSLAQDAGPT
jgi:hypothetical protein